MKGIPVSVVGCLQGGFMEYLEDCSLLFFKIMIMLVFYFCQCITEKVRASRDFTDHISYNNMRYHWGIIEQSEFHSEKSYLIVAMSCAEGEECAHNIHHQKHYVFYCYLAGVLPGFIYLFSIFKVSVVFLLKTQLSVFLPVF